MNHTIVFASLLDAQEAESYIASRREVRKIVRNGYLVTYDDGGLAGVDTSIEQALEAKALL